MITPIFQATELEPSDDANSFWCLSMRRRNIRSAATVACVAETRRCRSEGRQQSAARISRCLTPRNGSICLHGTWSCFSILKLLGHVSDASVVFLKEMADQCAGNRDRPGAAQRAIADTEPLAAFVNSQIAALQPAAIAALDPRSKHMADEYESTKVEFAPSRNRSEFQ